MDNLGKALHMATGVLLFIIAITSSIILYSSIIDFANTSLVISGIGNRAESMLGEGSNTREIKRAEVIMAIIKINSLSVDSINVIKIDGNTVTFKPDEEGYLKIDDARVAINSHDFEREIGISNDSIYEMTFKNNILTYEQKEG